MSVTRSVTEGQQRQGIDEVVVYTVDVGQWTTAPSGPTLRLWEKVSGSWSERTATQTSQTTATASGAVITLPPIFGGDEGHISRAIVAFTAGANKLSCYFDIPWEK